MFFFKQKTAYEMRISDWSSDVCSSDLQAILAARDREAPPPHRLHLAVAHAGEVSAHYIGGRLKHPFLLCERLRIEACAPWPTAIGINRDRRVHAAHFDAQVGGRDRKSTRLNSSH